MSDVQQLLEELAHGGDLRGANAVFERATASATRLRRVRRRRRVLSVLGTAVAIVLVVVVVAQSSRPGRVPTEIGVKGRTTTTTLPSATAAELAAGHWSTLPPAPIGPRDSESEVWTGKELIVWGGEAQQTGRPDVMLGDGAAYNPVTRTWRVMAAAPLSARAGAVAVWTGSEMVLWGGTDAQQAAADGTTQHPQLPPRQVAVAYRPDTDTWRTIGVVPLPVGGPTFGVWTGDRVVLFAARDAAAYDPATNAWQLLPPPPSVSRLPGFRIEQLGWRLAAPAGPGVIVAWSTWEATKQITAQESEGEGGADVFVFHESTNRWSVLKTPREAIPEPEEAFWSADGRLLVRGDLHMPGALGPGPLPEATDWYDLDTGAVTALPPDALNARRFFGGGFESAWTGDALFSFAPGSVSPNRPTDASVYDSVSNSWRVLPPALYGCNGTAPPVWTGTSILVYCAQNRNGGLEFVPRTRS